jgi:serine protease Do
MYAKSDILGSDTALHSASRKTKIGLGLGALLLALAALAVEMKFDTVRNLVSGPGPGSTSPAQPEKSAGRAALVDLSRGFSSVSKQVEGAVVNISSEQVIQMSQQEDMFRRFFGDEGPFGNAPRSRRENSLGSGVIVDPAGYVLTNNHVVDRGTKITVKLHDGRQIVANVVGKDPATDLAVVKINASNLHALRLGDSNKVEVGDWVLAFGSPFGLEKTMTAGIISAKGRVIGAGAYDDYLQTDAAINPGNSGGPLVNLAGEVVGINTVIFSRSGGFEGVGFAIPSDLAQSVYGQLAKSGKVTRGWLGVELQELTPELTKSFNLGDRKGVLVSEVPPGSPAAKAGVKSGDVLLAYNGQPVTNYRDLSLAVAGTKVGTTAKLKLLRQGQEMTLDLTVGERPLEQTEAREPSGSEEPGKLGITVSEITPDAARQLGISNTEGALVTDVRPGSPADEGGIRPGDVIRELNRNPIKSANELINSARNLKRGSTVMLKIERQGSSRFVAFDLS